MLANAKAIRHDLREPLLFPPPLFREIPQAAPFDFPPPPTHEIASPSFGVFLFETCMFLPFFFLWFFKFNIFSSIPSFSPQPVPPPSEPSIFLFSFHLGRSIPLFRFAHCIGRSPKFSYRPKTAPFSSSLFL